MKNVLLTGASGFIGSRLRSALEEAGHRVVCAGRRPLPGAAWLAVDFSDPPDAGTWARQLAGIDVVVNAAGIFREGGGRSFDTVHRRGPMALFDGCLAAGVARVIQLSALGADEQAATAYHRSKKAADDHLLSLPLDAVVLQPSLVFGPGGASAGFFLALASLPLLGLPAGGRQALQPVHVDDLVDAVRRLVETAGVGTAPRRIAVVGPQPLTLAGYLQALRAGLALAPAPTFPVPAPLVALAARAGDVLPGSLLDSASWQMLQRGDAAPAGPLAALIGRTPRGAAAFVEPAHAAALRRDAELRWLLPLLRLSLALVWLVTGWVSLFVFPVAESYALLARTGVPPALQHPMLLAAAGLDAAFGLLTLWPLAQHWRRRLWLAQAALIAGYSIIITLRLPEFWAHPYGPLLKNLPILALLLLLWTLDRGTGRERASA